MGVGIMAETKTKRMVFMINDPLKENYYELLAAIYKQAIEDALFAMGEDAASAKMFLKQNPFGLQADFDGIIKKLRGEENEED